MNIIKSFEIYKNSINYVLSKVSENQLNQSIKLIKKTIKNSGKIYIVGNGGSASIASHVSVDFAKVAKVPSATFNNANLITCLANDYGYEKWVEKAVEFFGDEGDMLVIISSSGKSKNIVNGCEAAKNKKFKYIITLTGHEKDGPVSKYGDINLWVNSKAYNYIENTHQIWLLTVVDLIIGKKEYPAN